MYIISIIINIIYIIYIKRLVSDIGGQPQRGMTIPHIATYRTIIFMVGGDDR